jgi:oligopeptide/dipeptide ABC transporter ATP-binding protein
MSEQKPLLHISNLKKHFDVKSGFLGKSSDAKVYAVDGVSFSLKHGETLGLVGESGCGKSTLGRTILRLYEPTSGEVHFEGENFLSLSRNDLRKKRRDLQIIFQDPYSSLNPRMKIGDILSEPFQIHERLTSKEISKAVGSLLETVGLPSSAQSKFPHEFSGGQRQRIGIARAIALRPKLIVADEPVSALDVSIQSQILNLLSDLKSKMDLSFIFIAHDLAVIEHISDHVAVMYLGRIVEYAPAEALYLKPIHPYTQALIAAIPEPTVSKSVKKHVLMGDVPSPMAPPSGCHFHPRCPIATPHCSTKAPELRNLGTSSQPRLVACHNV